MSERRARKSLQAVRLRALVCGYHVLVVWFGAAFDGDQALVRLDMWLPRITSLTADLPPDDSSYRPAQSART